MATLISVSTAENFLQYFENVMIKNNIESKNIIFYTRYVDDILFIYDHSKITSK